MSRTSWYKLQYVAAIASALVTAMPVVWYVLESPMPPMRRAVVLVGLGMVYMIPGRVSGYYWRDLYRARRLQDARQPDAAIACLERFIALMHERPRLRRLWCCDWSVYTRDPVVMALNNIGAARIDLDQLTEAEAALKQAIAIDRLFPVAYFNLAVLCKLRGEEGRMGRYAQAAVLLGYRRDAVDRTIDAAAAALAQIEGRPGLGASPAKARP
jgi:tetratricopeptide (TPR) repeat protein